MDQAHIVAAFRFELSKVAVPAIRERMVSSLRNVSEDLAAKVAGGLGMPLPAPMPRALEKTPRAEVKSAPSLSQLSFPGDGGIQSRKVALIVAENVDAGPLIILRDAIAAAGGVAKFVGTHVGKIVCAGNVIVDADASLENSPSVLFDAIVLPGGPDLNDLARDAHVVEHIKDAYRHCKTILAFGDGRRFIDDAGASPTLPNGDQDPGIILAKAGDAANAADRFIEALSRHRHYERDSDPPLV